MYLFHNRFINLYFIEYNNTYSVMFYTFFNNNSSQYIIYYWIKSSSIAPVNSIIFCMSFLYNLIDCSEFINKNSL